MNAPRPSTLYAVVDRSGTEFAWGASPSLARDSAAKAFACQWAELERAGYTVAPSTIRPILGGLLDRRAAEARDRRTPEQRRADRLYAIRWHAGPMVAAALAAACAAAWALATGIRN